MIEGVQLRVKEHNNGIEGVHEAINQPTHGIWAGDAPTSKQYSQEEEMSSHLYRQNPSSNQIPSPWTPLHILVPSDGSGSTSTGWVK